MKYFCTLLIGLTFLTQARAEVLIKDICSIEGVRDNQLLGYGLVVGLKGTGDRQQTMFSAQSLTNVLQRMGVTVPASLITVKNTAAVMVTGSLPAFGEPGMKLDVTASSIGDAMSLQGGLLIMTSLRGADGQVYAVAQGPVITGGFVAAGGTGGGMANSKTVNHPTVGRIPEGALIERAAPSVEPTKTVRLQLHQMDFGTAGQVAAAINKKFPAAGTPTAHAVNGSIVSVSVPAQFANHPVEFIAAIDKLSVVPERSSKIVINERTGTIVMGKEVHISAVAVMHGDLTVEVKTTYEVSQPAPFSQGTTQVIPQTKVTAAEDKARNVILKEGATVEDLVRGLSAIGCTPRDIIAILESLRSAGALDAELQAI
jgi:flagellar P-ring protein precursor FlgI